MQEGEGKREPLMRQGHSRLFKPVLWLWAAAFVLMVSVTGILHLLGAVPGSRAMQVYLFCLFIYAIYLRQIFSAKRYTAALAVLCAVIGPVLPVLLLILPISQSSEPVLMVLMVQLYLLAPCLILVRAFIWNIKNLERQ